MHSIKLHIPKVAILYLRFVKFDLGSLYYFSLFVNSVLAVFILSLTTVFIRWEKRLSKFNSITKQLHVAGFILMQNRIYIKNSFSGLFYSNAFLRPALSRVSYEQPVTMRGKI